MSASVFLFGALALLFLSFALITIKSDGFGFVPAFLLVVGSVFAYTVFSESFPDLLSAQQTDASGK